MPQDFVPLNPDLHCYVVGDIHGCDRQLSQLLQRFDPAVPIVFLGDYVDRGEHSRSVIHRLMQLETATCLMGNHEAMLLEFLEQPAGIGRQWLQYGGLQTLADFGVEAVSAQSSLQELERAARQFAAALGSEMRSWLSQRPLGCLNGNIFLSHAGADPDLSVDDQPKETLLWGAKTGRTTPHQEGLWLVHGHWIVPEPEIANGHIALDTGAYATGRLTAAEISSDGVRCLSET